MATQIDTLDLGKFSREFRTPCVMFTGHPSLRFGDAVHFMELWGGDQKNVVLLTGSATWRSILLSLLLVTFAFNEEVSCVAY